MVMKHRGEGTPFPQELPGTLGIRNVKCLQPVRPTFREDSPLFRPDESFSQIVAVPHCGIRTTCRWFAQSGAEACAVSPLVVTDLRTPEELAATIQPSG